MHNAKSKPMMRRANELFNAHLKQACCGTDRMFAALMIIQWLGGISMALWVSPYTWIGETAQVHSHVWAAVGLGFVLSLGPVLLSIFLPGHTLTRHVIAIAQAGWSALLIHLSGGRIETHFHIFGSLALLAFYRDWRVLITASAFVALDHVIRGAIWPQSVYGITIESPYRWIEHAAWVVFEDIFLIIALYRSRDEVTQICVQQASLEETNVSIERKVDERTAELNEAKVFFQTVLDSIDSHICILNSDGMIIGTNAFWNRFAENAGNPNVGVGTNYLEVCKNASGACSSGAEEAILAIEAVIEGNSRYEQFEYECDTPEKTLWFQVDITPLAVQSMGAVVVAHKDITLRVEAEDKLRVAVAEARRLAMVAEATDNSVVISNAQRKIEWVNKAFSRVTGYEAEEVIGKSQEELLVVEDTERSVAQLISEAVKGDRGYDAELVSNRKDGTKINLSVETRPILGDDGKLQRYFSIQRDITERKQSEVERDRLHQELRNVARQAGMAEMATGVLHNVGNVVNSVNVSANIVGERLATSRISQLQRVAEIITEHEDDLPTFFVNDPRGEHFSAMLRGLSDTLCQERSDLEQEMATLIRCLEHVKETISMQQSFAKVRGTREKVCPTQLFEEALKINIDSLTRHDIQVSREFANDLPSVNTEKHKVLQILVNLISNAKQAMSNVEVDRKELIVRIIQNEDFVQLEVQDCGVGIAENNLNRIFKHGFTTKSEGHGFGLHSSANAAQELGGSLSVFSEGKGRGATFTLRLPLEAAADTQQAGLQSQLNIDATASPAADPVG